MTEVVVVTPPSLWSEPTPAPVWRGKTNQDLLEYAQDLETALDEANVDKIKTGNWIVTQQGKNERTGAFKPR